MGESLGTGTNDMTNFEDPLWKALPFLGNRKGMGYGGLWGAGEEGRERKLRLMSKTMLFLIQIKKERIYMQYMNIYMQKTQTYQIK